MHVNVIVVVVGGAQLVTVRLSSAEFQVENKFQAELSDTDEKMKNGINGPTYNENR